MRVRALTTALVLTGLPAAAVPTAGGASHPAGAATTGAVDFILTEDLVLGLDPDLPLGRVGDVDLDSEGNIYALDSGFGVIRKFAGDGAYLQDLGRQGEGPGEFESPLCLAVSPDDRIFVGGVSSRITILSPDGTPAGDITHVPLPVQSMCFDEEGNLYVASALGPLAKDKKVIHKFNPAGEPVLSFGEPQTSRSTADRVYSSGFVDLGRDGLIYFAQWAPQEVRTYTADGTPVSTFSARAGESPVPEPKTSGDSVMFTVGNTSLRVFGLTGGRFLTGLVFRDETGMPQGVALDLYDAHGDRLATHRYPGSFGPLGLDSASRLYVAEERNDLPVLVRYRVVLPDALR